jgi:hypothetical protein
MGVVASEAYDGKAGETYDLRYMVHAIHAAGAEHGASTHPYACPGPQCGQEVPGAFLGAGQPLVYYRTNGVYFFGSKEALAKVASWPGTGCQVVAGSGAPSTATGTQCDAANTAAVTKNHNFIEVHYPRALNDCGACHVNGSEQSLPDPTRAVAVTYEAGAAPWNGLLDDKLIGPSTAACMSCHGSMDAVTQFRLRKHAYDNGWAPSVFPNGRQSLLDALP